MREYKIHIDGGCDFVVVFPDVIGSLIAKIHDRKQQELVVGIEEVMPWQMTEYLLRVNNTNRFTDSHFRFRQILEDPVTKEGLYQVIEEQLQSMGIDDMRCFGRVRMFEMITGSAGLEVECTVPFLWACKDASASFFYTFSDGRSEKIIIEY